MPVTSTTLASVNVFQFSGAVTDAEIKAAFASTIVNGVYVLNRAIYLDNTADLTGMTGGLLVDFGTQVLPGFILHTGRDKTKSTFKNFTFLVRTGLSVGNRSSFVRTFNGTALGSTLDDGDGISQDGGGFVYGVPGNPGGGDPRYLLELPFSDIGNITTYSQEFTEQELQILVSQSKVLKGLILEKVYGFPQIFTILSSVNVVVYRSTQNTQSTVGGGLIPIRLYPTPALSGRYAAVCYVDSYVTRNNADISTRLIDTFSSSATNRSHVTILNNYTRETWFGTTKTNFSVSNWAGTNTIYGGVLKKLQFVGGAGGVVRAYDSRSTTAAQKCKFAETGFVDFLDTDIAPTTDSEGKMQITHIGAIATGSAASIVRYTGQRFTFQKFGSRVQVSTVDMTSGDNDLSAFTPVTLTTQNGLVRDLAAITAATSMEAYRELLEELHAMAITLIGSASYNAPFGGNLFELSGNQLNTAFTSVLVDKTAAQKISYNATTGALIIKSDTLASSTSVTQWSNSTGPITTANGATITGVYADSVGQRVRVFGLDPEDFGVTWYLRHRLKGTTEWTNLSGTGNQTLVILTAGEYEFQARVPGYDWDDAEIDTTISLSLDMALRYQVSANNTPQYTMVYDAVLEAIFAFDPSVNKVAVSNTTSGILSPGFAELYQATQRIQHIPALVWTWESPVAANATSQKILIPTGNPISMFLTDESTNSVKITCPVIHADSGSSADDRVRGNPSGYSIILGSPATAESAGLANQIISSLGGPNYDSANHGLSVIKNDQDLAKAVLDLVKSAVDAIKPRTDLIPDEPAAVGDAMTLTAEYDAAKTAATQSSVDMAMEAVFNLGTPLQAADYIAPANDSIAEVKAKTDLIPANPAAVGDAMTLTTAYDAAKTAATQTSVDDIASEVSSVKATVEALDLSGVATQASVDALGSPLQADDYVASPTASEIATQVELAIINEDDGQAVLQAIADQIANENISATAIATAVRNELATELGRIDVASSTLATATQVGAPLQASAYVEPANSDIAYIKAAVDELENTDISTLATSAELGEVKTVVDTLATSAELGEVKTLVENLENTDISTLATRADVEVLNAGVKNASLLIPHTGNLPS